MAHRNQRGTALHTPQWEKKVSHWDLAADADRFNDFVGMLPDPKVFSRQMQQTAVSMKEPLMFAEEDSGAPVFLHGTPVNCVPSILMRGLLPSNDPSLHWFVKNSPGIYTGPVFETSLWYTTKTRLAARPEGWHRPPHCQAIVRTQPRPDKEGYVKPLKIRQQGGVEVIFEKTEDLRITGLIFIRGDHSRPVRDGRSLGHVAHSKTTTAERVFSLEQKGLVLFSFWRNQI